MSWKKILVVHFLNGRTEIKPQELKQKGAQKKTKSVFHAKRTRHSLYLLNGRTNHGWKIKSSVKKRNKTKQNLFTLHWPLPWTVALRTKFNISNDQASTSEKTHTQLTSAFTATVSETDLLLKLGVHWEVGWWWRSRQTEADRQRRTDTDWWLIEAERDRLTEKGGRAGNHRDRETAMAAWCQWSLGWMGKKEDKHP